jgi:hypothetical protein
MSCFLKSKTGIIPLLFILLCGCAGEWQKYNNNEYGFSILLPRSWEKKEGALKSVIMALAPMQKKGVVKARPNMNVFVTELPEEVKLDIVFELNKEELAKSGTAMDKFTEGEIYAGSLAGRWLSFEGRMQDFRLKIISAVWVKDRRIYTVTCSSPTEEFNQYASIFNKIMRSLRVK